MMKFTIEELSQKIGVKCIDNTSTYFEPGVELEGKTPMLQIFMIDDPIANPGGYGFEINIYPEKGTFKFVYDGCGIKIPQTQIEDLGPEAYAEAIQHI